MNAAAPRAIFPVVGLCGGQVFGRLLEPVFADPGFSGLCVSSWERDVGCAGSQKWPHLSLLLILVSL